VTFTVDGTKEPAVTLASGKATYSTAKLATGTHTITAAYGGSTTFAASTSTSLTETIKAKAAVAPTFSPIAGSYATAQSITLADTTSGAVIHYTTNKTTPTASSAKYTGAIKVSATTTIEAIAVASGYANSPVATATYTIAPAAPAPTFLPVAGTYSSAQTVKLADKATSGLVIHYTTNNQTPTTSSARYPSSGIRVRATETIKAIAVANGYSVSPVASATYRIN
jgi:hypothetical protein